MAEFWTTLNQHHFLSDANPAIVRSTNISCKTIQRNTLAPNNFILLLPCVDNSNGREYYPVITSALRKNLVADLNIDVRTSDYQCDTILQHSADIILPIIDTCWKILTEIGISFFVESIISFLKRHIRSAERDSTLIVLTIRISQDNGTNCTEIRYEGSIEGMKELSNILEEIEQKWPHVSPLLNTSVIPSTTKSEGILNAPTTCLLKETLEGAQHSANLISKRYRKQ